MTVEQPLSSSTPALGLLSLSAVAASAAPIPIAHSNNSGSAIHKQRRLSSAGQARRRLSDARDAASRTTAAAALSSLAGLNLSSSISPPPPTQPISIPSGRRAHSVTASSVPTDDAEFGYEGAVHTHKGGKKRGTIFKCESCSKVYRHPSCLIKHRWEHAPQWREASKFLLSKHQQVQMLEAAAILSHLSPSSATGTSLPDDRALWPSYLSGGVLPPPSTATVFAGNGAGVINGPEVGSGKISSSVPARSISMGMSMSPPPMASSRSGSAGSVGGGPRLHDYTLPATHSPSVITQFRPGLFGVPTGSIPVEDDKSEVGMSVVSEAIPVTRRYSPARSSARTGTSASGSGWSLPSSSVRSDSGSRSDDDDDESELVDVDVDDDLRGFGFNRRGRWKMDVFENGVEEGKEEEEEEWDGMDMDMEV